MRLFRRLGAGLAALAVTLAPATAAAEDSALNKEGYWKVGRGDADSDVCMASINTETEMLVMYAVKGELSLTLGTTKGKLRKAKTGALATDAYSFEFEPEYSDEGNIVALGGEVNSRVIAALRLASELTVALGGKQVFAIEVEGTGLEGALDAVIACSQGKSGWWGPGVGVSAQARAEAATSEPKAGLHKDGAWYLEANDVAFCVASAQVGEGLAIQLMASEGLVGLAFVSDNNMRRGRKGLVETDAYSFPFKPKYSGSDFFVSEDPFDSQAIFALRRASALKVSLDGRVLADLRLEGSGLADSLEGVIACSMGEDGWWGEGAKQP